MTKHVVINVGMGRCGRLAGSKAHSRSILVLQASPFVYERVRHILVIIKIHQYMSRSFHSGVRAAASQEPCSKL